MRILLSEQRWKDEKNILHQSCVFVRTIRQEEHMKNLNSDLNFKEHPVPLGSRVQPRRFIHTDYGTYGSSE